MFPHVIRALKYLQTHLVGWNPINPLTGNPKRDIQPMLRNRRGRATATPAVASPFEAATVIKPVKDPDPNHMHDNIRRPSADAQHQPARPDHDCV